MKSKGKTVGFGAAQNEYKKRSKAKPSTSFKKEMKSACAGINKRYETGARKKALCNYPHKCD